MTKEKKLNPIIEKYKAEQMIKYFEERKKKRIQFHKNTAKLFNDTSYSVFSTLWIIFMILIFLCISISAGIGSSGLIRWLNSNMVSDNYIYYASYGICALTMLLLNYTKINPFYKND